MAQVKPFKGIRYNPSKVEDYSKVICPPYDVISPSEQEAYYAKSEYNFIRIEYTKNETGEEKTDSKYAQALKTLENWLDEGILMQDSEPAIYIHDHCFYLEGKEFRRRTIIGAVKIEDWSERVIRPHEGTLPKARSDREMLLQTIKANTSPVFAMYEDQNGSIKSLLNSLTGSKPSLATRGYENDWHYLWIITEPGLVDALSAMFDQKPLYIADGHHRYESALKHRHQQESLAGETTGDEPFNFLMMEMVDFEDPGLINLPPHRLVRGASEKNIENLMPNIEKIFDTTRIQLDRPDAWREIESLMHKSEDTCLAVLGPKKDRVCIASVKDQSTINQMMSSSWSDAYKQLDVSIVDHVILQGLLGFTDITDLSHIAFNHNREEVERLVKNDEYQLAIILRPLKPDVIKSIADAGERMPRKSTYFHPKLPSGLVLKRLV